MNKKGGDATMKSVCKAFFQWSVDEGPAYGALCHPWGVNPGF